MHIQSTIKRGVAILATATLGLTLAACGDDASSGHDMSTMASDTQTASNGDVFNQADVDFATTMIPHHAQAIQMVTLTDTRQMDPAAKQLADNIRHAQTPEVEAMTDWLTSWDKEIPATTMDHSNGDLDMSDMPDMSDEVPGMMSSDDMQQLADASDAEFQDLWLQMMKKHHEGAIEMAKAEEKDGSFPAAVALAMSIIAAQELEIEQIDQLLAG